MWKKTSCFEYDIQRHYVRQFSTLLIAAYFYACNAAPCNDSLSIYLNTKAKESLSQSESIYISAKQIECQKYTDSLQSIKQDSLHQIEKDKKWKTTKKMIIVGITCGVIVSVIAVAVLLSSGGHFYIDNSLY